MGNATAAEDVRSDYLCGFFLTQFFLFMSLRLLSVLLLGASLLFTACKSQEEEDDVLIQEYLTEKGLTAQKTPEGLYYIIEEEGNGEFPVLSDDVTVDYTGYLLDGSIFDSTNGSAATFPLSGVILGWQIGIPKFSKGGKGKLLIPSNLAYGDSSPGAGIPANSVLIFDVHLIDF